MTSRRGFLVSLAALTARSHQTYSFHVLGLLRPVQLLVSAHSTHRIRLTSPALSRTLEAGQMLGVVADDTPVTLTGTDGGPAQFTLTIGGTLSRSYFGTLRILRSGSMLIPIVIMDGETAVRSIIAAELPAAAAHFEAMAAQAIVARSFLIAAGKRHHAYDFCDTTHCQFLRSPAPTGSLAGRAAQATESLVLFNGSHVVPARYSAACGGHTDDRLELNYHYQSVRCETCLRLGLPRRGHGLGLCQEGAMSLAEGLGTHKQILAKYFPATHL